MVLPPKGEIKLGSILHKTDGTEPRLPQDGDKYFDFDATLKGRVLLLPIGIHGLAIILNKKVKAFIKRLKREEEGEEKKKNG